MKTLEPSPVNTLDANSGQPGRLRSLRVCLLTNILPPYLYPVFLKLNERVSELQILLSAKTEPNRPWQSQADGLKVTMQRGLSFRSSRKHPHGFAESITRHFPYDAIPLLYRLQPDVIISAELGMRTAQAALYRRLFPASRLVIWVDVSEHTVKGLSRAQTALRRALIHNADAVMATGQSCRRYLIKLGVPAAHIVEVPFVGNTQIFRAVPLERDSQTERRMLYVGQLIERKGLRQFIGQLSLWSVEHPNIRSELGLVGDGPQRAALECLPLPANLSLRFCGNVSYQSLPGYYAQAGICVLPTLADTWALVVNEALAAGLPVLGSLYSQGVEELIRNGENGWTFFPDRPGDVRRALDRTLLAESPQLARMRAAARRSVNWLTPELAAGRMGDAIALAVASARPLENAINAISTAERDG